MKNIYLICAAGLSTSIMVENMKKVASDENFLCNINAIGVFMIDTILDKADCMLLGPQIRFEEENVINIANGIPVGVIDMKSYGKMDGLAVINQAKELMGII